MAEKQSSGRRIEKVAMGFTALVLLFLAGSKYADYLERRLEGESKPAEELLAAEARIDDRLQRLEASLANPPVDPIQKDREVMALRQELSAVEEERKVMNEKFDEISRQERIAGLGGETPADPNVGLSKEERMIQKAVAIAAVSNFNKEWGFVMLDGGTNRGLSVGTRLALRRGPQLVALVEVSTVEPDSCVANLVKGGPGGAGNAMPLQGDAAITWPPF
jgi:hypothetical protein